MPTYGFKKDPEGYLIIDEEEKAVFLKIVEMYLNGQGTNKIAKWLNDEGIPTKASKILKNGYTLKRGVSNRKNPMHKTNNAWSPGTIMGMLKRTVNYGKRRFKTANGTYEFVSCPPLIDEETHLRIQAIRASNAINKRKEDKYFYLLKGLIQCGNCQNPMHGRIKPSRHEYTYKCNSKREVGSKCTSRGISIGRLNAIIWNAYVTSKFYHIQINNLIREQMSDTKLLDIRFNQLEAQLRNIEIQEKQILERKKNLLKKSIDPRVESLMYDELMDELDKEAKVIDDNKRMCLYSINTLNEQIRDNENVMSDFQKGFRLFINAKNELDSVWPPFENRDIELKARRIIRNCIKNIKIEYIQAEMKHKIEVTFNEIGLRHEFMDKEPYEYSKPEVIIIEAGINDKVIFEKIIPFPKKITILNDDPKFTKQWEKDFKSFEKAKENHEKRICQKLPPLLFKQLHR